ncbi:leucine--tRNA ligase [Blautia pseudococcoides]|uniref:leucine--tRNA ligase n=1 Tax=Blautia pseudococcoides TaxID=1796616 RepID=UPI00148B0BFB|nr:leucine--tRNA ligase [Blautia pseudococcoides]QJU14196.1 leucine--tRNA ligase [Blautia pseudococcoides]
MAVPYNHKAIEQKWKKNWEEKPVNTDDGQKPKYYCLDMFPYPSGNGLHVGHWRGYVISDVWSRYKMMQGYYLIHPMGWDAFGLPAENYAIKMGVHPAKSTAQNVANIKKQINDIAAIYDWDREVNTTDPGFYKWTQWIFVKMFKEGLAYEKEFPINWCPSCKTGLANEEVVNGCCERCGSTVTKKNLRQWMLRITKYADRLLSDLDKLDWPEKVKKMQSDWIGKSYGAEVDFPVEGRDEKITVYTTRPDTLHGATFMVLAPEHKLAASLATPENKDAVEKYIYDASMKSNVDRLQDKEKTGVFTGTYAVNPLNGAKVPIWLSDYVLADYGTGAIMCVPAHDARDFEFATKFHIPIIQVIAKDGKEIENMTEAYTEASGTMINSGEWNGMESSVLKKEAPVMIEKMRIGKKTVNYKLRDWVFSRQRYWGEPIPIIHCPHCGNVPVPEDQLPLTLPEVESYEPTGTGESPLAAIDEWVNTTCPVCGAAAKRETNTMPQWAGSSWYFLRYVDNKNDEELVSNEKADKYLPVDMYIGGVEHAVLHLLYSRFYTKFLCDIGAIDFDEPFQKLFNQGMITGKNGIKMSKSKGNVVSPDDLVRDYGCDSLRLYELFVGPPELDAEWDDRGIDGVYRFLNRFWKLSMDSLEAGIAETKEMVKLRHKLVFEITQRLESFSLNTVISGFMEYNNKLIELAKKTGGIDKETIETFIKLLAPFAPHLTEELWEAYGHEDSVFHTEWPEADEEAMKDDEIEVPVQINGKTRAVINISAEASKEEAVAAGKEAIADKITGTIVKEIYVPKKIINIVQK